MIIDRGNNGRNGCVHLYNNKSGIYLFWRTLGNRLERNNLSEVIKEIGDVQGRRTNLKAAMTHWDTWRNEAFKPLASRITQ